MRESEKQTPLKYVCFHWLGRLRGVAIISVLGLVGKAICVAEMSVFLHVSVVN